MTGEEMREIRKGLKMSPLEFARLIGYTGKDANDEMRVSRHERSDQIPLYLARYIWLIRRTHMMTGSVPVFPEWDGYDFDHSPDPGHEKVAHEGQG